MNLLRSYVFLASIFLFSNILECYGASFLEPIERLGLNLTFPNHFGDLEVLKAADSIKKMENNVFVYMYNRPLTEVLLEIQQKYGKIEIDCTLFVQIYQRILEDSQTPFLLKGFITPQLIGMLFSRKIAYMSHGNQVFDLIGKLHLNNKGQWLINVDDDLWVGMGSESPFQGTLITWAKRLKTGLYNELMSLSKGTHPAFINDLIENYLPPLQICYFVTLKNQILLME